MELRRWKLEFRKEYMYVVWNSHGNKRSKSFRFLNEDLQRRILSYFGKLPDLSGANKRKKTAEVTMIEISQDTGSPLRIPVRIDGLECVAYLDTGAGV